MPLTGLRPRRGAVAALKTRNWFGALVQRIEHYRRDARGILGIAFAQVAEYVIRRSRHNIDCKELVTA